MSISVSKKSARQARWRARVRETKHVDALLKTRQLENPPRSERTIPTDDSQESWNRYLASQGLSVNSGKYLKDAAQGCGLLHCGGNDTVKQFEYLESKVYQRSKGKFNRRGHGPDQTEKVSDDE